MILTVTPNPALDVTYRVPALEHAAIHRVDRGAVRAGGKGVNVARVLAEQGEATLALVPVGGTAGDTLVADLEASSVPCRAVHVGGTTRTTITIVDGGGATALHERGEPFDDGDLARLRAAVHELLPSASVVVVSGSAPPVRSVVPAAQHDVAAGIVRSAHAAGVPAIVDAQGDALLAAAAAGADVVKPNRAELVEATGIADPLAGARALQAMGAGIVVVSLGGDGMLLVGTEVVRARLAAPLEGNPTGAGDAAVAALATTHGEPLEAMARRAVAWSAAAVLHPLAGSLGHGPAESDVLVEPLA